jgi:outer membrane lipoprotein SlyB
MGATAGLFLGGTMGIAVGGTAYNAAIFLTPVGAFIGWLVSKSMVGVDIREKSRGDSESTIQSTDQERVQKTQ